MVSSEAKVASSFCSTSSIGSGHSNLEDTGLFSRGLSIMILNRSPFSVYPSSWVLLAYSINSLKAACSSSSLVSSGKMGEWSAPYKKEAKKMVAWVAVRSTNYSKYNLALEWSGGELGYLQAGGGHGHGLRPPGGDGLQGRGGERQ